MRTACAGETKDPAFFSRIIESMAMSRLYKAPFTRAGLAALFLVLLLPAAVLSGEENPKNLADLSLEELMNIEVETVFGASRFEQKTNEAPSAVSVITADTIRKFGYRTLGDILAAVRGFFVSYDRIYNYVGIRGFSRSGSYNNHVLLLVDGHRVRENVYDQTSIGTDFVLDVDLIDRVEVIRGPGSSLYGTGAFLGVVNVITRQGRDIQGLETSAEAGSDRTYRARLTYGERFARGPEVVASVTAYDSDGNNRLYFPEFDAAAYKGGIARDLDHDQYRSFFGKLSFRDFTLETAYSFRRKRVPTASFGTVFNENLYSVTGEHFYADLRFFRELEGLFDLLARVNYNIHTYSGNYPYDCGIPADPACVIVNKDSARGKWIGGELQATRMIRGKHRVILGGEFQYNLTQDQRNFDVDPYYQYLDDKRRSHRWAVYGQGEIRLHERVLVNAGVRHDRYDTFGGTTNPRVGIIISLSEATSVKLLYGTAFRAPNVYELFFNDGGLSMKANGVVQPETIKTYEAVVETRLNRNIRMSGSVFYYRMSNLIVLDTDAADGLLVYRNLDEVEARGAEIEIEGRWQNGLEVRSSWAFQEARNQQDDEWLANSPRHLVKINVAVPLVRKRVFLSMEEQYMSRRKTLTGRSLGSHGTTNLTVSAREIVKGLEGSMSVYNLFDKEYADPGSTEHVQDSLPREGRSFRMKLTYRF